MRILPGALLGARVAALLILLAAEFVAPGARAEEPTGYVRMPACTDGSYRVLVGPQDDRHWGRPETIRMLVLVAREWHRRHGSACVLEIGDISRRDGGPFPPHVTHRDGCNIDITTAPRNVCHVEAAEQDLALELARLFFHFGAKEILYNGAWVRRRQPGVTEWPKHDDHFHVIVDPARVPREGEPLLVPDGDAADGTVLGPRLAPRVKTGPARRFTLGWRVLGGERPPRAWRLLFDRDADAGNGVLFDSGVVTSAATSHALTLELEDGAEYSWQVVVTNADARELALPWQRIRADFRSPSVVLVAPGEGEDVAQNPVLRWECDADTRQASVRVEATTDPAHKRIPYDTGEIDSEKAEHRLRGPLAKGRVHWWRVTVDDGHGNRGSSAWHTFKAGAGYAWTGDPAVVGPAALPLREGPSEHRGVLVTLDAGTPLTVLSRKDEWLRVEVRWQGKPWTGYVYRGSVRE